MELVFNTSGNDKQKQVVREWLNPDVSDIVYGGSKGSGKSFLGCSLIFADALIYAGTHYFIARSTLADLRKFTIPSVYEVFSGWKLPNNLHSYNGQDNCFNLYNGSKVFLLDAKFMPSDPLYMRFGSMQMTRGWIEEAGEFEEDAKNNLNASVGRWKNNVYNLPPKLLQTCNPAKNYLYREYYRKHKDGQLESWKRFIQAFPQDNKMLPDGYLENLHRTLNKNQRERLLFGNWEYDDDPSSLVDYAAICDMFTNEHVPSGMAGMSVDIALQGRDKLVICTWSGCRATIEIVKSKSDAKEIEQDIKRLSIDKNIPRSRIVADSDGVGAYLTGYLKGIHAFHGNAKAFQAEYANIKSECAYKLAELINKREIWLICDEKYEQEIKEELAQLKNDDVDNDEGKKRLIGKDEMKAKLGRSPDFLDTLIMGMFVHLKPKIFIT